MKRWLKAYVIYLAGALAVLAYVLWSSRRHGIDIATLISSNGHGTHDPAGLADVVS